MKKKTRQTGLLLSVLMLATTILYPVSAFAEETTEAPAEAVTEAAEKSDAKTMMTGNWAPATRERIQSVIDKRRQRTLCCIRLRQYICYF